MTEANSHTPHSTTGVILAGGRGSRLGGIDKGFAEIGKLPLIEYVLEGLSGQVDQMVISANRSRERYATYGHPIVADEMADFQGPLAGMLSALDAIETEYALFMPCDGPIVPHDYCARMHSALGSNEIAVATNGSRLQPVYSLVPKSLRVSLRAYLQRGDRKIDLWYAEHPFIQVDFSDQPNAFLNINRPEDLTIVEAHLRGDPT
jgi:molybdopterin-guanine dinucleotide biosynthesis protein A